MKYSPGDLIKSPEETAAHPELAFIGVVVSGLATSVITPAVSLQCPAESLVPGGTKPCLEPSAIYVTQGSVFGLLSTITGREMPGRGSVEAHCGSRSTIVFQIPKHAIDKVRATPPYASHCFAYAMFTTPHWWRPLYCKVVFAGAQGRDA